MSGLSINGVNTKGQVFELKEGTNIKEALKAGQKDGLDQVYVEAGGKNYVVQGDGLNLKGIAKGTLPKAQLELNGKTVEATIKEVDNELNTRDEGLMSPVAIGGMAVGVVAVAPQLFKTGIAMLTVFADANAGQISGPSTVSKVIGGIGVAAIVGGVAYTVFKGSDHTKLQPMLGKEISNDAVTLWDKIK
jgi:hypothetical protein